MKDNEWLLSVSIAGHDAAMTLLHNGEIAVSIKEERLTGDKFDNDTPLKCIEMVSDYTLVLDKILLANINNQSNIELIINSLVKQGIKSSDNLDNPKVNRRLGISESIIEVSEKHHLYHAACGYHFSGFDEAICLVMDGWGSSAGTHYNPHTEGGLDDSFQVISADETTSIFKAEKSGEFSLLKKISVYDPVRTDGLHEMSNNYNKAKYNNNHNNLKSVNEFFSKFEDVEVTSHLDIGIMYGVVNGFLGFMDLECGKTMGLSSYGEEDETLPPMFFGDSILSNKHLFNQSRILDEKCYPVLEKVNDSFQKKANLAYSIQKALEKVFIERVKFIDENYKCKNIVLSGGCALNVVGNSVLAEKFPHMNFFVDPVANDSGQSLGYALQWINHRRNLDIDYTKTVCLGPEYPPEELRERIEKFVKEQTSC